MLFLADHLHRRGDKSVSKRPQILTALLGCLQAYELRSQFLEKPIITIKFLLFVMSQSSAFMSTSSTCFSLWLFAKCWRVGVGSGRCFLLLLSAQEAIQANLCRPPETQQSAETAESCLHCGV